MTHTNTKEAAKVLSVRGMRVGLPAAGGWIEPVRGIDFSLERGDTLGLVGESGCGKSMTALALMGLLPDSARASGEVNLLGTNLLNAPESQLNSLRGNRVAMVFQEPMTALNPLQTIGAQIAEPLRIHDGLTSAQARLKALSLLDRVAMPQAAQRLDAYPHQLSGGQRQRVGIAMALACEPDVLIADEPTTALDVTVQAQILALIEQLVRDSGMAMVLISHDLRLVAKHVQHVAVMYAGQFVEHGNAQRVFDAPAHPYTRGLIAARPSLTGPRGQRLHTIGGTVPGLLGMALGCAFEKRCQHAQTRCSEPIALVNENEHATRCVRTHELTIATGAQL